MQVGTLEYDAASYKKPEIYSENVPIIKIRFITEQVVDEDAESKRRHDNLQAEADEHYRILVQLQKIDAEFDASIRNNYDRKREVESTLSMSENWHKFIKTIHISLGWSLAAYSATWQLPGVPGRLYIEVNCI